MVGEKGYNLLTKGKNLQSPKGSQGYNLLTKGKSSGRVSGGSSGGGSSSPAPVYESGLLQQSFSSQQALQQAEAQYRAEQERIKQEQERIKQEQQRAEKERQLKDVEEYNKKIASTEQGRYQIRTETTISPNKITPEKSYIKERVGKTKEGTPIYDTFILEKTNLNPNAPVIKRKPTTEEREVIVEQQKSIQPSVQEEATMIDKIVGSKIFDFVLGAGAIDPDKKVRSSGGKIIMGDVPLTPAVSYSSFVKKALVSSNVKTDIKALSLKGIGGESQVIVKAEKSIPDFKIGSTGRITETSLSKLNVLDTGQIVGGASKVKVADQGKNILKETATFYGKAGKTSAGFVKEAPKDTIKLSQKLPKEYQTAMGDIKILSDKKLKQISKDFFVIGKQTKRLPGKNLVIKGEDIYTKFISGELKGGTQLRIGKEVVAKFPGTKGYPTSSGALKELSKRELRQIAKDDLIVYPQQFKSNIKSADLLKTLRLDKTLNKRVVKFRTQNYNQLVGAGASQVVTAELTKTSNLGATIVRGASSQTASLRYIPKPSVTKPVYVNRATQNIKNYQQNLRKEIYSLRKITGQSTKKATKKVSGTKKATKQSFSNANMNLLRMSDLTAQQQGYKYKTPSITRRIYKYPRGKIYLFSTPKFYPRFPIIKKPPIPKKDLETGKKKKKKKKTKKSSDVQVIAQGFTAKNLGLKELRLK